MPWLLNFRVVAFVNINYVNTLFKGLVFQSLMMTYNLGLIIPVSKLFPIKFFSHRHFCQMPNFHACIVLAYSIKCSISYLILINLSHSHLLLASFAINVLMVISRPRQRKQRIFVRNAGVLVEARNVLRPPDIGVFCLVTSFPANAVVSSFKYLS